MSVQQSYNAWSATYDAVENKTRDLEKYAGQTVLAAIPFKSVLEIGAGTGKNTVWLAEKSKHVTAVDLSDEMQAIAKAKIKTGNVELKIADIRKPWDFRLGKIRSRYMQLNSGARRRPAFCIPKRLYSS